ncbi:MAG TPA: low molecular weight protein-tyrosine-phosphatase [Usitatibacter sp.]|nr:low molecular weight protein-tyrosine-phosphatase [Usitatibacter sp.]
MTGVRSILFVCRANMCRSPSAEAVMRAMLRARALGVAIEIDSAGTHDFRPGAPPHVAAAEAGKRHGYDLNGCVARRVMPADFDRFDMILAMDEANVADLRRMAPTRCKRKIELLLDYGDRFYGEEIPDPIGEDATHFDRVLEMIEDGCGGLVQLLVRAA